MKITYEVLFNFVGALPFLWYVLNSNFVICIHLMHDFINKFVAGPKENKKKSRKVILYIVLINIIYNFQTSSIKLM